MLQDVFRKLEAGESLRTVFGRELRVVKLLGSGGRDDVYEVELDGKGRMALRLSRPGEPSYRCRLMNRIRGMILAGSPSKQYLWPIDIVDMGSSGYGFVMALCPEGYSSLGELLLHPNKFSSCRRVIDACLGIVSAFLAAHDAGYCFQDVNSGNFFINPQSGEVFVCALDELLPIGTDADMFSSSRFSAPEVVADHLPPNVRSDLHSMGVLAFVLLCFEHPLEGVRAYRTCGVTLGAEQRLYGTDPVFIFDPNESSNRPVQPLSTAQRIWPELPQHMRDFLCRAFSQEALHHPHCRPTEHEWIRELVRFRSEVVTCRCGNEVFLDGAKPRRCENCGLLCGASLRMEVAGYEIAVVPDARLYGCQIKRVCSPQSSLDPQLWVVAKNNSLWGTSDLGLCNVSHDSWRARLGGREVEVAPGRAIHTTEGLELEILGETVRVCGNVVEMTMQVSNAALQSVKKSESDVVEGE